MDDTLNRILSLIKERNISKGKFLSDLGFNKSAIAAWERGEHASYKKKLPEIAAYFGVSLDWLAGNGQKEKPAAGEPDISFNDFSFAFHNYTKELTEENKQKLLEMARIFKMAQDQEKKDKDKGK